MIHCIKKQSKIFSILFGLIMPVISVGQTFSNTDAQIIDSWNASLTKTITVSGLPTSLSSPTNVLQQVNIDLGNTADATKNLQSYVITLKSPNNTVVTIKNSHASFSVSKYNVKFRDYASLVFPVTYGTARQPFDIGYYRTDVSNAFAQFNGENPNGIWTITITETSLFSGIAFNKVDLIFGPSLVYNDITATKTNDDCSAAQCMETGKIIIGTNNGYVDPGPTTDPLIIGSCDWNGAKNNSAWFYFNASATSAKFTISGLSNDLQIVAFSNTGTCAVPIYNLVTGGCPRDAINDTYTSPRYTGTTGTQSNMQLNMSSLTIGSTYYVLVDGTGGNISPFYITMESGAAPCSVLPIDLLFFNARPIKKTDNQYIVHCDWSTATEINNSYYTIERSLNGINFYQVGILAAVGNSQLTTSYSFEDIHSVVGKSFYRLKQTDRDGSFSYSEVKLVSIQQEENALNVYPNPANNQTTINIHSNQTSDALICLINPLGQKLFSENIKLQKGDNQKSISLERLPKGTYLIQLVYPDGKKLQHSLLHQ